MLETVRLLDDREADRLLREAAVPLVPQRFAAADEPLGAAGAAFGFPVVLKGRVPGLAHRSDAGAVALGLRDDATLEAAAGAMRARFGDGLAGFLLQPQLPAGPELIAGYLRDPSFGPVVLAGLGGVRAEADPDVAMRLWPASEVDLRAMTDELRGRRLLDGFRGAPALDRGAFAALLAALGRLGEASPGITSIDLNPVLFPDGRPVAVDALVTTGDAARPAATRRPRTERTAETARFFEARSVAVVGASEASRKAGNVILRNLLRLGFAGRIHPVNPGTERVLGLPCAPSVEAIGEPVDLVVAAIPREAIAPLLEDCGRAGARSLIVATAGFADGGPEGAALEKRLATRAAELGIRLMGPNSIGTVNVPTGLVTSLAGIERPPAGGTAFAGSTGLFSSAFPRWMAAAKRQGAACFASLGNKADIDEADLLEYFAVRPDVTGVALYLEGIRDGRRLYEAIGETARRKPVTVLKSGRTPLGKTAAASHTGALAADDRLVDAALRQAGAVRVDDFGMLFDQARGFERLVRPSGRRLGVVSITGVGCVLAADACGACGLELPPLGPETLERIRRVAPPWAPIGNPVDMWSTIERAGPGEAYRELAAAVIEDDAVDALLMVFISIPESWFDPADVFGDLRARRPGKPVLAAVFGDEPAFDPFRQGLETLGIPVFDEPARAVRVLAGVAGARP
jgi:acyl-CoA synthetase (NDP forming)